MQICSSLYNVRSNFEHRQTFRCTSGCLVMDSWLPEVSFSSRITAKSALSGATTSDIPPVKQRASSRLLFTGTFSLNLLGRSIRISTHICLTVLSIPIDFFSAWLFIRRFNASIFLTVLNVLFL